MKIVITGGLGYLGTELCKVYSGEARFKKIVVIDNKFFSDRVEQLRKWGIEFIHGDIMDKALLENILSDTDIVYHLAGITDVAYTKTESNSFKDKQIKEIGIDGTKNVINFLPKNAKIVFPSTHVVFEGFKEEKFEIVESEPVCPVLTYSSGKAHSEEDIKKSGLNFVILRLATVFGKSSDTMRINIMPNLFSKITSQNGKIKLFSGGKQHKSLVSIHDVVNAMKFTGENENINKEIFHISSVNTTVKEVAKICKKISKNVTLIETDDEIPNLGYTISNKKILSTGFKFRNTLFESINEMINCWSKKSLFPTLEMIKKGSKDFIDDRGKISNYELTEPINLIGYIESKKGTVRANHYHPIQEQKCLLIKGQYISVLKDLADPNAVIETNIINPGDLAIIHPNVAHSMVFTKDSIFLNLVRGEREHENYGFTHTIFYELVDKTLRNTLLKYSKNECRVCGNSNLNEIISLGLSPLANNLLSKKNVKTDLYPLELNFCPTCTNCQLSVVVPPKKMFDNYLYVSSTSKAFRKHFEDMASQFINRFGLTKKSIVYDIGSNDGVFLSPLIKSGIRAIGIDPAKNLVDIANLNNLETIHGYFNEEISLRLDKKFGKADLITAFNVFAHADNLEDIVSNVFRLLKSEGTFVIEVQYLFDTINDLTFDNIYHEHVNYWSATSLKYFFDKHRFNLFRIEHVATHGGSLRVFLSKDNRRKVEGSVKKFIKKESEYGLNRLSILKNFSFEIKELKNKILEKLNDIKKDGKKIVGYGSPAKATTVLNYYGLDTKIIDYIIEDNELKHGKFVPGINIPIVSIEDALINPPDFIIVFAWNFYNDIKKNNYELIEKGAKFVTLKHLLEDK